MVSLACRVQQGCLATQALQEGMETKALLVETEKMDWMERRVCPVLQETEEREERMVSWDPQDLQVTRVPQEDKVALGCQATRVLLASRVTLGCLVMRDPEEEEGPQDPLVLRAREEPGVREECQVRLGNLASQESKESQAGEASAVPG